MSTPQDALNFFTLEATECIDRLETALHGAGAGGLAVSPDEFVRAARTLRGAATMHRLGGISDLAAAVERAGRALRAGDLQWSSPLHAALVAAVDDLKVLLHNVRRWTPADDARSARRVADLGRCLPASAGAPGLSGSVPIIQPAGGAGSASADAYFAAESAEIAAALETFVRAPEQTGILAGGLARARVLRGVAALADRPPLPDVLDAIERAGRVLELQLRADAGPAIAVLAAAAPLLRRAATDLQTAGARSLLDSVEYQQFRAAGAQATVASESANRIVPIDELFYQDGSSGIVSQATNPPTSPGERFRLEMVSQAEHIRALIAAARQAGVRPPGARDIGAGHLGAAAERAATDLRQALRAARAAALGFGARRVADFLTPFADGGRVLDFLALNALDEAAALLADPATDAVDLPDRLGGLVLPDGVEAGIGIGMSDLGSTPGGLTQTELPLDQALAGATATAPPTARTTATPATAPSAITPPATTPAATTPAATTPPRVTPTGRALQDFLQDGIVGISHLLDEPLIPGEPSVASGPRLPARRPGTATPPTVRDATPRTAPTTNGATAGAASGATDGALVPIESLLYRGSAALEEARTLRHRLKDGGSPETLSELFDLLDLAATS
jgi:hypothetical protein